MMSFRVDFSLCSPMMRTLRHFLPLLGLLLSAVLPSACDQVRVVELLPSKASSDSVVIHRSDTVASPLPVLYLTTPNGVSHIEHDVWTPSCSLSIVLPDSSIDVSLSNVRIEGRGNSSWEFPKKPYNLKLATKSSLLGMPRDKRWILLANWMDRTLVRNEVAFFVARQLGFAWSVHGRFVELFVDGRYRGNYYLCEKIKRSPYRVDIEELLSTDVHPDTIRGGYLLEFDKRGTSSVTEPGFASSVMGYRINIKEPDDEELNAQQLAYISDYVNQCEAILSGQRSGDIAQWIDLQSFADFFLVQELVANAEPRWPRSCYMYKSRHGRLTAGPVWDFDWGTYLPYDGRILNTSSLWYAQLFADARFVALLHQRVRVLREAMPRILDHVADLTVLLQASADRNFARWPINTNYGNDNGDENLSYPESMERLQRNLQLRMQAIEHFVGAQ